MGEPIELVIFDCDGVLVDSEWIAMRLNRAVGAECGWPMSEAEWIERFVGRSSAWIGAQVLARVGAEQAARWSQRYSVLHHEAVAAELAPVDGIVEALDAITLPTCVASGGSHEKMRRTLGRTGLYDRFAGRIFSATQVERGKPAPDLFEYAAASMGVAPATCVVVEDSRFGVEAARAAGMRCLAYSAGITPADRLEGPGTTLFDDMRKLPELLAAA